MPDTSASYSFCPGRLLLSRAELKVSTPHKRRPLVQDQQPQDFDT